MTLKRKGELCIMTMNNDAKFEIELTCHFKIDMKNLTNFDPGTQCCNNFKFWLYFGDVIITTKN